MTDGTAGAAGARSKPGSPRLRRAVSVAVTVLAVTASILSSLIYFVIDTAIPGTDDSAFTVRPTLGFFAAVAAAAVLVWRHERPVLITGLAVIPPLLLVADTLAALIALAALAASRRDRVLWGGAVLVFAATAVATARDADRDPEFSVVQVLFGAETTAEKVDVPLVAILAIAAVLTAIPLAVGLWRGTRLDIARREQAERALHADLARQDERTRIAREMHDVLGHRLSLLSLQAGALQVENDAGSGSTADAARTIRATVRESLADLRQIVGILREGHSLPAGTDEPDLAQPQPTLADIPELIADTRRSGVGVNVTMLVDDASAAPPALGVAAYRTVQEALTNVLRHASGATADVTVRGGPDVGLTIEVVNPLSGDVGSPPDGTGTGLVGIAERVSALGGTVSTGPTDHGTFVVTAWLPWDSVS